MPNLTLQNQTTEFLRYTTPNGAIKVEALLSNESIWLTQKRMAELFGVGVVAISKHLDNIYESGELQREATVSILETVQQEGSRQVARKLERVVAGFFDYVEGIIERRNTLTMESFAQSVNKFLSFNEYRILEGYGAVARQQADQKAFAEYEKFNKMQRIESDFDREVKKLLHKKGSEE
jgi:hypothetical protein